MTLPNPKPARPARRSRLSRLILPSGLSLLLSVPAVGQFPPLTVPRGLFRIEISGGFTTADRRFRAGESENLATDFIRSSLGTNFFPELEPADQLIRNVTGATGPQLSLGTSFATHHVTSGTFGVGLAYGLTSTVTLFAHLPIVRVKVRSTLELEEGTGRAGFNPADPIFGTAEGLNQAGLFFLQFDQALASLQQKLAAGDYNSDPALRALAEATLASATTVRNDLRALTVETATASPLLPLGSSASGTAIRNRISELQNTLSGGLGVTGFSNEPVLPETPLSNEDFARFLNDGAGPVAGSIETPSLSAFGDAEAGVAIRLLDQLSTPGTRRGVRVALQGLARLPTATLSDPRLFFDVGTGDKQTDLEGTLVADLVMGRIGLRAAGGYSLQLSGVAERRIAAPDQPAPFAYRLARISRNPGDLLTVGVTPMLRIADNFAVTGGAYWRHKGTDRVTLAPDQEPIAGVDPAVMELETDGTWTTATLGLSYSVPLVTREGKTAKPLDAGATFETVVQSSGPLRIPRTYGVRFWLRLYR